MLVLFAALLLYLGVVWNSMNNPLRSRRRLCLHCRQLHERHGFSGPGGDVPGTGGEADHLFREGEKVARGQTVALLYSSPEAAARRSQLQALETERSQLQYALAESGDAADNARLSEEVVDAMTTLHASVAAEDFTRLEDQPGTQERLVYQRADAFGCGRRRGSSKAHRGSGQPESPP